MQLAFEGKEVYIHVLLKQIDQDILVRAPIYPCERCVLCSGRELTKANVTPRLMSLIANCSYVVVLSLSVWSFLVHSSVTLFWSSQTVRSDHLGVDRAIPDQRAYAVYLTFSPSLQTDFEGTRFLVAYVYCVPRP